MQRSIRIHLLLIAAFALLVCGLFSCGAQESTDTPDTYTIDKGVDLSLPDNTETVEPLGPDPDGDGFDTAVELLYGTNPNDSESHPLDYDGDKIPDPEDPDIDGDGVDNGEDAFPYDAGESVDTDQDGKGDNADADDDNDGYSDEEESTAGTDPLDETDHPQDLDGDGIPDEADPDMDGDGLANTDDAFPMNWVFA